MGFVLIQESHAEFYKYIDKNGVVCFADNLQVVPEQYRSSAVLVQNEQEEEIRPAAPMSKTEPAPMEVAAQPRAREPLSLTIRLTISATVVAGGFLIIFFMKNMTQLKQNSGAFIMVRGALIAVVSAYLVFAHAGDVMDLFGKASRAVDEAQRTSAEKGRKAGQFMKQMDQMTQDTKKIDQDLDRQAAEPQADGK